jgi:hypothetical protein
MATILPDYFADVAKEMRLRSASIKRDFASHRPSGGRNREDLVARFLEEHLPKQFGVDTGLLISPSGCFSSQVDLVVVDHLRNAPLHASRPEKLWPIESAYVLFEVKTQLTPTNIADAVKKCRRFKTLDRQFLVGRDEPRTRDSLFVLWAYESPATTTAKDNLKAALSGVPRNEHPDFVIIPDRLVARGGSYLEISRLGQPASPYRTELHSKHGSDLSALMPEDVEVDDFGENSLAAWYVWLDSWLRHAGPRASDPLRYLPPVKNWGKRV